MPWPASIWLINLLFSRPLFGAELLASSWGCAEAKFVPERSADQTSKELSKLVSVCSNATAETMRLLRRLAFCGCPAKALACVVPETAPDVRAWALDLVVGPSRLLPAPCKASPRSQKPAMASSSSKIGWDREVTAPLAAVCCFREARRRRRSANCKRCEVPSSRQLSLSQRAYLTSQPSTPPPRPKRCRSRPSRRSSSRPSPFYKERKN